jgi:hypothetical protein
VRSTVRSEVGHLRWPTLAGATREDVGVPDDAVSVRMGIRVGLQRSHGNWVWPDRELQGSHGKLDLTRQGVTDQKE